jgi:two-component system, OmpR family, sensor kinase
VIRRAVAVLHRTGTRTRLTGAIVLITLAALGATFLAVYQGTASHLRQQIDRDLGEDAGGLIQQVAAPRRLAPAGVARRARRYINALPPFGPSSELIVVRAPATRAATNEPELLGLARKAEPGETVIERRTELGEAHAIRSAPDGYSTIELRDAGEVRLLTRELIAGGREVGRVTVGQPLASVGSAEAGVSRTFLLAGSLAMIAALAAGIAVAARTTAPLRRMSQVAEAVDSGELSTRMTPHGSAETRQLAESLNHMLDRLEDAFARQRGFVSDASHELRTPLTAIGGQIEVLARAPDASDETRDTAEVVAREVERMERLVDDMLLLARTDEGLAHNPKPIEVSAFLREVLATLSLGVDRKLELGPVPGGTLIADADRMTQVIGNIVRNAIEHTLPAGSIRVAAVAAGGRLTISVDDDGPGIPATQRDQIFGRFYRADPSRSRWSGGSGLGLAIAKAIVEAHGGRIWVGAAPGGGARVAFELPGFRPS